jgi:nicotinamidase-related amidase
MTALDSGGVLEDYKKKGLAARVGFGRRPALLIVDFIKGFTDLESPLAGRFDPEVLATRKLLGAARRTGIPVFFTTTSYDAGFLEAGVFILKVPSLKTLRAGSRWVQIDDRLRPRAGEIVVDKKYASAFFGTSLASTLRALDVDTLLVAGCTTSGCVRATVVDGMQNGLRVIVVRECVGDRAPGPHQANLIDIDGKYGDVESLPAVLRRVEGRGGARRPPRRSR